MDWFLRRVGVKIPPQRDGQVEAQKAEQELRSCDVIFFWVIFGPPPTVTKRDLCSVPIDLLLLLLSKSDLDDLKN